MGHTSDGDSRMRQLSFQLGLERSVGPEQAALRVDHPLMQMCMPKVS